MEEKNRKKIILMAKKAKEAFLKVANISSNNRNKILFYFAKALKKNRDFILQENQKDINLAKRLNFSSALIDRLTLSPARLEAMCNSFLKLRELPDPVGRILKDWTTPAGLKIFKVSVPIGVILIIYESRPDVTADCLGLCIKSGNVVILRGGSEAFYSNQAIFKVCHQVLKDFSYPSYGANFVFVREKWAVDLLLKLNDDIDLVIPRGGEGLIRKITRISRIPVIKHYKGICHIYVDKDADLEMAKKVCFNAKVQRPATCNAMESMLVHRDIALKFLPLMLREFLSAKVKIRGCPLTLKIARETGIFSKEMFKEATDKDYSTEYLDLILAVKVVKDLEEAVAHINKYGSHHSDAIITKNKESAQEFLKKVDSACVYHNASTRLTDGYQFGMGAEMGISTDRLHARGPMALEELTTYKYTVYGNGQIRI